MNCNRQKICIELDKFLMISGSIFAGFKEPLVACCGSHAPYNCTPSILCGTKGSSVCAEPSTYASWDGLHLTEAAYKFVASAVLNGPYAVPSMSETCPTIELNDAQILYSNQCSE